MCFLVLEPYKYSGYPMLIKTIQMEIEDAKAFSKEAALLPSACELCYHTVNTSALNAEELRRENGIEVRTLKVLSLGSVQNKTKLLSQCFELRPFVRS